MDTASRKLTEAQFGDELTKIITKETDFVGEIRNGTWDYLRHQVKDNTTEIPIAQKLIKWTKEHADDSNAQSAIAIVKKFIKNQTPEEAETAIVSAGKYSPARGGVTLPTKQVEKETYRNPVSADAIEMLKELNKIWGAQDSAASRHWVNEVKQIATPELKDVLAKTNAESLRAFEVANTYFSATADRLGKKVIKTVLNELDNYPSAVVKSLGGSEKQTYDKLIAVKKAFTETEVPDAVGAKMLQGGADGVVTEIGKHSTLSATMYEENILKPLRHHITRKLINRDTKILSGKKLESLLKAYSDDYLNEVFGKGARGRLETLSSGLRLAEEAAQANSSVLIQLVQGGAAASLAFATLATGNEGENRKGAALKNASYVLLTPLAASRIMSSPQLNQIFFKGLIQGPKTSAFYKMLVVATAQNAASRMEYSKMKPHAIGFYNNLTAEEDDMQDAAMGMGPLGPSAP